MQNVVILGSGYILCIQVGWFKMNDKCVETTVTKYKAVQYFDYATVALCVIPLWCYRYDIACSITDGVIDEYDIGCLCGAHKLTLLELDFSFKKKEKYIMFSL